MNVALSLLKEKAEELTQFELPVDWRIAPAAPAEAASMAPDPSWPEWNGKSFPVRAAREEGWTCGETTLSESACGLPLDGAELLIEIQGFAPFTLWIDGEEAFREERNWRATGPIAEPLRRSIEPGRRLRLVLRQQPTAMPSEVVLPVRCALRPRPCLDMGVEIGAAAAQLELAAALAETDEEKELVARATEAVNQRALRSNDWDAVRASLKTMEDILSPLSPKAKRKVVHLIGHTHIDLGWLWTWEDTVLCTRRDFRATADLLDEFPDLTFANSQSACFEIVREHDPDVFERMRRLMASGRWENVAALWDDSDLNMVNGESLARQLLYAAQWCEEHLGCTSKVFWAVDVFGHPGNMPQIARLAEMEAYFHTRCHPDLKTLRPIRLWKGIDGTTIPVLFTRYSDPLDPLKVLKLVLISHRCGLDATPYVWCIADHGGGMSRLQLEILAAYRDKPLIPTFAFSTPTRVVKALLAEDESPLVTGGETHSQFPGCFTTHADVKGYNRRCENALLTSETLAAIAGIDRREALRNAWKDVFFLQFHDVLCGCSAPEVYTEDAPARNERALAAARAVIDEAMKALVRAEGDVGEFALFNALGFPRTEPVYVKLNSAARSVVDRDGRRFPVQQLHDELVFIAPEQPAFGWKPFRLSVDSADEGDVDVTEAGAFFRIETDYAVAYLEKCSGVITSYYDKALGCELINYAGSRATSDVPVLSSRGMNLFQIADCAPVGWSAWQISDTLREESLVRGAEVELMDNGPVFARFRVRHRFRSSRIYEDILFFKSLPRVEFAITVDWREPGGRDIGVPHLRLAFHSRMAAARSRAEAPFAVATRPADGTEQPMQTWVDLTGEEFGFALLNDCKYGYEALGGRLRLSLLRTAYAPDPVSDHGEYTMRFAFVPHRADAPVAEIIKAGMGFNRAPLVASVQTPEQLNEPFLKAEGAPSVVCTVLHRAGRSDGVLARFYETEGRDAALTIGVGDGIVSAREVNLLEHPCGEPLPIADGRVALRFRPY